MILKLLYSEPHIHYRLKLIAERINKDYRGLDLVILGVLNGASYFVTDLTRLIEIDHELTFVQLSSYGNELKSNGKAKIIKSWDIDLTNKHVLILEDLLDSGHTMQVLLKELENANPRSVKIACLILKDSSTVKPNYYGFDLDQNTFVVGYGMDFESKKRNLKDIYQLQNGKS